MSDDPAPVDALLRAAEQCFAEHGFEGAATRDIAQRAQVNQGLIRYHFGSKDGLWRELVRRGITRMADALAASSGRSPLPIVGVLEAEHQLVRVVLHELCAPDGDRRRWLLQALAARQRAMRQALGERAAHPPSDAMWVSWWCAAAAFAALGPALFELLGRTASQEDRRIHARLLERWLATPSPAPGPWAPAGRSDSARYGRP